MKRVAFVCIILTVILWFCFQRQQLLFAQEEPILETYSVAYGSGQLENSSGIWAALFDRLFGGGTAKADVLFKSEDACSSLLLRVWRIVRPDEITFALLVFGVEVRGRDAQGEVVYSRDLEGFTFGDSSSGHWSQTLRDLPATIQEIQITYFGNYE